MAAVAPQNAPRTAVRPQYSRHVRIHAVKVQSLPGARGSGGFVIDSSQLVEVTDCELEGGSKDDAISVVAGDGPQGAAVAMASRRARPAVPSSRHGASRRSRDAHAPRVQQCRGAALRRSTRAGGWRGAYASHGSRPSTAAPRAEHLSVPRRAPPWQEAYTTCVSATSRLTAAARAAPARA